MFEGSVKLMITEPYAGGQGFARDAGLHNARMRTIFDERSKGQELIS